MNINFNITHLIRYARLELLSIIHLENWDCWKITTEEKKMTMIDACTMASRFRTRVWNWVDFRFFIRQLRLLFGVNNEIEQQPPHPQQDSTREAESVNCSDDYRQSITRLDAWLGETRKVTPRSLHVRARVACVSTFWFSIFHYMLTRAECSNFKQLKNFAASHTPLPMTARWPAADW